MESWHKIWSSVLGLVVFSQGNNSHMQYQDNAGSIRTLLIYIVLKGYSFTRTNILVHSHFSTLRMLVGPSVWALIHVSLWEGCCVCDERMPFPHTDHRWIHEKFQHSTGFFPHLCFSLAPNAIHQWNINGSCIKTSFTWICWSDRLCSTPHYFYVQLFPFNSLTRYTYTCFQCSEGLPSHDVGLPFSKYVTYFLSVKHIPANIKLSPWRNLLQK